MDQKAEGDPEAVELPKGAKYIVTANRETLEKKDARAAAGEVVRKGSELFDSPEVKAKGGYVDRLNAILENNKLFSTAYIVREELAKAYRATDEVTMRERIDNVVDLCKGTENKHFEWFAKLLTDHLDGILAHARYFLSSGKVEGTMNMIKTLRRTHYGLPKDDYFFLKVIDRSYHRGA